MTYKVSVTGIDGCGKSTAINEVIHKLAPNYLTASIGRPTYISGPELSEGKKYLFTKLTTQMDKLHAVADSLENKMAIASVNIFNLTFWSYINANVLTRFNPDIAIYGRDRIVDPAVYSTFYMPFTKNWSSETRLKISQTISLAKTSDTLIYMDVDPAIAIERIEKRIEEEKTTSGLDRKKWEHMHENFKDLTNLKKHYDEALDYLSNHSTIYIKTINVNDKNLQEVSNEMEQLIRKKWGEQQ